MGARHGDTAANHTDLQSGCGQTCVSVIIKLREGSLLALIVIVIVVIIIITADTLAAVTPSRWMHTVKYNHKSLQLTVTCRH